MSHTLLWKKILEYGINGNFLQIVKSMYSKVKSCVRATTGLSNFFSYEKGLCQGCLMSPILFALFLNDLNDFILEKAKGITLWDVQICALLYADDLILLAESEEDLQLQMNQLHKYQETFQMEVNQTKTKVMIFSKSKKKQKLNRNWKIGHHDIEETDSYKYLGIIFKNNGSFLEHVQYIAEKANKALHTLIAKAKEWQGFAPEMLLHVFDHTVAPILSRGAEV